MLQPRLKCKCPDPSSTYQASRILQASARERCGNSLEHERKDSRLSINVVQRDKNISSDARNATLTDRQRGQQRYPVVVEGQSSGRKLSIHECGCHGQASNTDGCSWPRVTFSIRPLDMIRMGVIFAAPKEQRRDGLTTVWRRNWRHWARLERRKEAQT